MDIEGNIYYKGKGFIINKIRGTLYERIETVFQVK
jgi:hypothetical protein